MTRKHFKAIADTLRSLRPILPPSQDEWNNWLEAVESFARMCATQNPNFKRDRFMAACGAEP